MKRLKHYTLYSCIVIFLMLPLRTSAKYNDIKNRGANSQFLVSIARPLNDECTYKNIFKVCGSTKKSDVRIRVFVLKGEKYTPLKSTKGELYWDVGESGIFAKEVLLPNEGNNKICICSYDKNQENNLKIGENMQINEYNITFLNNDDIKVSDILDKLF